MDLKKVGGVFVIKRSTLLYFAEALSNFLFCRQISSNKIFLQSQGSMTHVFVEKT